MDISKVSEQDGKLCAQLLNLLKHGKWDLSGSDIVSHSNTVAWVHQLASKMAAQLKGTATPPPSAPAEQSAGGFKVKSMGKLPAKPAKSKKK